MTKFICPYCKGKGLLEEENVDSKIYHKCQRCNGTGFVNKLQDNEK